MPATFATYSFFFTDTFLNLTGVYAVEGRALAIHEENRGKQALPNLNCWIVWVVNVGCCLIVPQGLP